MGHATKNYTEDGGNKTVIGGVLELKEEAEVIGLPKALFQEESKATTVKEVVADLNDLLKKLKAAGIMADE